MDHTVLGELLCMQQKHPWLKVKVITINLSLSNHCDIIHILPVYHGYVYTILQDLQNLRGIDSSRALLILLFIKFL